MMGNSDKARQSFITIISLLIVFSLLSACSQKSGINEGAKASNTLKAKVKKEDCDSILQTDTKKLYFFDDAVNCFFAV